MHDRNAQFCLCTTYFIALETVMSPMLRSPDPSFRHHYIIYSSCPPFPHHCSVPIYVSLSPILTSDYLYLFMPPCTRITISLSCRVPCRMPRPISDITRDVLSIFMPPVLPPFPHHWTVHIHVSLHQFRLYWILCINLCVSVCVPVCVYCM